MTPIIILAGGKSSRMGRDKTRLEFRGETLLNRTRRRFSEVFSEVFVSVGRDDPGAPPSAAQRVVGDADPYNDAPSAPAPFLKGVPSADGGGLPFPAGAQRVVGDADPYNDAPSAAVPSLALLPDIIPALGPISGLHAALSRFGSAFLVAADMPLADPKIAAQIIEVGIGSDACAATVSGHTEPTFAYYSGGVLPELLAAIDRGDYSLHRLLSRVNTRYVEVPPETMLNINYPEDYEKLIEL